jgi:hypothetical protein
MVAKEKTKTPLKNPTPHMGVSQCGNLLRMGKARETGGRPYSVDPQRKQGATARVSFALTPAQLNNLRAAAHRAGVPVSVYVRDKATR